MSTDPIVRMLGRNATLVVATADLVPGGWRITPGREADPYAGQLEALGYKACRDALTKLGARKIEGFTATELREWDAREATWRKAQGG